MANHFFEAYQPNELISTSRILNTPSEFARNHLFYIQEIGYLKSLKSHLSKRSNLNSYLFLIVLSGEGTITYHNLHYSVHPFDCALIDCMEQYSHISDSKCPWELMWIHFNGQDASAYYEYIKKHNDAIFTPSIYSDFIHILEQLQETLSQKSYHYELMASKLITDLLTLCITVTKSSGSTVDSSIHEKLHGVRNYLDRSFQQKILLDDLSHQFYISKYHLSREFKRIFGITINDYIIGKRITYAKEQLRFTSLPIEQIATQSGIWDPGYFNKVFKKSEGMTASDYRKKWRG